MKIHTPYAYKAIDAETGATQRLYVTPSGKLPSVTTILNKTQSEDKQASLAAWRKRVGYAEAQRITTEAARVGTHMHLILENWAKGADAPVSPEGFEYMQAVAMAQQVKMNIERDLDEVWGTEVNLYYPKMYGGTTDLVGVYKGKPCIMDFKQTNKPKKKEWIDDYFLQGAAYAMAHNKLYGTDIKNIAIFMCSRAGEWQLFEAEGDEFNLWTRKWMEKCLNFYYKKGI